jgi:hypothetical protein
MSSYPIKVQTVNIIMLMMDRPLFCIGIVWSIIEITIVQAHNMEIQIPTPMSGRISARYIHVMGPKPSANPKAKVQNKTIIINPAPLRSSSSETVKKTVTIINGPRISTFPICSRVFLPTLSITNSVTVVPAI